jgi:coenzyme F420-0:L-glutamate ligase/coenzyme F420-1:gamma-L-glutamate ligase
LVSLYPVQMERASSSFDIISALKSRLAGKLRNNDLLVISSKYVAMSEGRKVSLKTVKPSVHARRLGKRFRMSERLCELVIRESDRVIGGVPGFLLTVKGGLLTPNAGIDKSNVEHGMVVLYPRNASASARRIREAIKFEFGTSVGVVICDSRLMPMRRGTTGVALAASGLRAILDMRGKSDLFGNRLKVTTQAVADDISSASQLLMGESNESVPVVLVRGLNEGLFEDCDYTSSDFGISADECVYVRSFGCWFRSQG